MSVLRTDAWRRHNIWEHSATVRDLYRRRARDEAEEMTCAAQAAEILADLAAEGDTLVDVGCGSGYFFHSLRRRGLRLGYRGFDATACLVEVGREQAPVLAGVLARAGLRPTTGPPEEDGTTVVTGAPSG